jgi:hypothetical protein
VLEVDEAASAAAESGGTVVVGRNADTSAPEPFRIEQVALQQRASSGLYLSFQQVYPDDTKTNWTCQLDERCRSMSNGVWTALSGQFTGSVVGNFSASVHGAMGSYKVISVDGCLVRSGAEKTSEMQHTLPPGDIIEVSDMVRLDSGVQRFFFTRPDLKGWVSANKEDGTPLLELLAETEDEAAAADQEETEPMLAHMMHSVTHGISSADHTLHQAARHIHHSEESARKFLTDATYREQTMEELRHSLVDDAHKISQEIGESQEMVSILVAYAEGHPLTEDEKQRAIGQLLDICKVIPALGIFLLPGGAVFLPLLAKVLPFSILPSAFAGAEPSAPPGTTTAPPTTMAADSTAASSTGKAFEMTLCQSEATASSVGAGGTQVTSRLDESSRNTPPRPAPPLLVFVLVGSCT